ncbi:unnamed protein product [Candida parapsilosis]
MCVSGANAWLFVQLSQDRKNILKGVKDFTTIDSFPISSINVTPKKVVSKFVQNSPSLAENENKFRSRNSFIIARSTLSSLLKENTYELKIVSKGVSNLWSHVDTSFKTYFKYLSLIESMWHDKKRSSYNSILRVNKVHTLTNSEHSSSPLSRDNNAHDSMPQRHRFRVKKLSGRTKRPKIRNYESGFKISSTSLSCNYGIVTEDIFK